MAPTAAFAPRAGLAVSHVAPQVHYIKHTYIYHWQRAFCAFPRAGRVLFVLLPLPLDFI